MVVVELGWASLVAGHPRYVPPLVMNWLIWTMVLLFLTIYHDYLFIQSASPINEFFQLWGEGSIILGCINATKP